MSYQEKLIKRADLKNELEKAREADDEEKVKRIEGELQEMDDLDRKGANSLGSEKERRRRLLEKAREMQKEEKEKKTAVAGKVKLEPGMIRPGVRVVKRELTGSQGMGTPSKVLKEEGMRSPAKVEVKGVGLESASQMPLHGGSGAGTKGKGVEDVIAGLDIEIEL